MLKLIEQLIEQGADLNEQNEWGETLLMQAAEKGDIGAVQKLLSFGVNLFLTDQKGQTALMKAVLSRQSNICALLLKSMGTKIYHWDKNNERAIDMARRLGFEEIEKVLESVQPDFDKEKILFEKVQKNFEEGKDINPKNGAGQSFLEHMICEKYNKIAGFLIEKKVDINTQNNAGFTPLMIAVLTENEEMVEALLLAGADLMLKTRNGYQAIDITKIFKVKKSIVEKLTVVTEQRRIREVKKQAGHFCEDQNNKNSFLLKKMSDPERLNPLECEFIKLMKGVNAFQQNYNIKNEKGDTPLVLAVLLGDYKVVGWLLELGVDVNMAGRGGQTPLHAALMMLDNKMVQMLLSKGADVEQEDFDGDTPLLSALKTMNQSGIKLLIGAGADIYKKNSWGFSALDFAVKKELFEQAGLMKQLYMERAGILNFEGNEESIALEEALIEAVQKGAKKDVLSLLEQKADVNIIDESGEGLLFSALRRDRFDLFETLISFGAKVNIRSLKGKTLVDEVFEQQLSPKTRKKYLSLLLVSGFDVKNLNEEGQKKLHQLMSKKKASQQKGGSSLTDIQNEYA